MSVLRNIGKIKFRYFTEFLIPRLTKATDEGLFEKLIDGKAECLPFFYSITADIPTVVVQTYQSISEILLTNRIQ